MEKQKWIRRIGLTMAAGAVFFCQGATAGEKEAPMADTGRMMMEHIDMDCTICHGESGPKGFDMGNHPKQKCTDCHVPGTTQVLKHKEKRTSIAREMMLKHGAALNCKLCHGETGAGGRMMLEHVGMDCQTCHVVEER